MSFNRVLYPFSIISLILSLSCYADTPPETKQRSGYSFFGAGYDLVDYEENTVRIIDGKTVDVETASGLKFTQHSGAYISVNSDWGFYLGSSSTLGESQSEEQWQIDDISVITNKVSFERQRIEGLITYRFAPERYFLLGVQYSNIDFKRFAAHLTPEAASFGVDETTFSAGTVSESVWDLSLKIGYEMSTLFDSNHPGWQYQVQAIAGLPLTTSITNTDVNEGQSYNRHFGGIQLRLNLLYGYQFNEHIVAALSLELALRRRDAISHDVIGSTGITEFPENTLLYSFPSFILMWSF